MEAFDTLLADVDVHQYMQMHVLEVSWILQLPYTHEPAVGSQKWLQDNFLLNSCVEELGSGQHYLFQHDHFSQSLECSRTNK